MKEPKGKKRAAGGHRTAASWSAASAKRIHRAASARSRTSATIVFNETPSHFLIDGKAFKMSDPPLFVVHVGTVEEWHIMNVTEEIHDFHLHQAHFLVKEINGVALAHPYWADSFISAAGKERPSRFAARSSPISATRSSREPSSSTVTSSITKMPG